MKIREDYVNRTAGHRYGDSDIYSVSADSIGELFKNLQKEFGRCESKMYIDTPNGAKQVGWVFARMSRYQDCRWKEKESWYCQETWVTVYDDNNRHFIFK